MTLHTHVFSPLFLLISTVVVQPSYGAKHLNGETLAEEICRHTSSHEYCVGTMIPGPPLTTEGNASTALGWTQIRALEAIARELSMLGEHDKAIYKRQREISKGILGPRPEPKPKRSNSLIRLWLWLLSLLYFIFRRERVKAD
ncbi:hypothetical protein HRI_000807600 [Hibiscus trionum]|uniref:Pectinesterase inhibitor domain-containing protein n=1 Tax=Hibiscus trionum TaxID=183268 RepID=A0A9W7H647_HIBTR|nr:hypothetical protein HRI_000807600 [Hibiscus trionum]